MKSIAIIIPCFNEEESLPQLFEKLPLLEKALSPRANPYFIFVDDGSKDKTYDGLVARKNLLGSIRIVRHAVNQNLGAALKTGIAEAPDCDYIGFLDSDCTYEPAIILRLLDEVESGADIATVSPYHPQGKVDGVPEWRLFLSKGCSFIYRVLLHTDFFTYTAMVRVMKSHVARETISERNDFAFVAESLIKAIRRGYVIREVPTVLAVRKFGVSKMNVVRTIRSHLTIIRKLMAHEL